MSDRYHCDMLELFYVCRAMSDRSRNREDGVAANTNSNDPKLLHARVFIGNLATDKVTRADLINVFGKYGHVLGKLDYMYCKILGITIS